MLLTGASSGIGRELALELARRRGGLVLMGRRSPLLTTLADECRALGAEAEVAAGDVADAAARSATIDAVRRRWGSLDVLVNNAGTSAHGTFADSDEPTLRRIMEVNFFAAVELTRLAIPLLSAGRRPAIVNVGSILGHRAAPFNSEYAASKSALRGWSEALRAELASQGIDVLLVSPGTTDTEFFAHLIAQRIVLPWKAKGVSPTVVARQIVRGLERNRREIFPNWRGRALVVANRLVPGAVDWAMTRLGRRR